MIKMKRQPTHPGIIIKEDYLAPLSLTITEMSSILGVSRKTLSKIVNERGAITPDMALRLSKVIGRSPESWLLMQDNYDLHKASSLIDLNDLESISFAA